jgi:hypothetical protein
MVRVARNLAIWLIGTMFGCTGELAGDPEAYRVPVNSEASTGVGGNVGAGGVPGAGGAGPLADAQSNACNVIGFFQTGCANIVCHDDNTPAGGLDLLSINPGARMVNRPSADPACADRLLIDAMQPQNSFILEKLTSQFPECGTRMPQAGIPLTSEELACVQQWVLSVATGG